jgi:hypothetical protein
MMDEMRVAVEVIDLDLLSRAVGGKISSWE